MKYIREGRFGPPKAFKTGAVVGTYPRPLLAITLDEGGLDVIKDPIRYIKAADVAAECRKPTSDLAPLTAIDLCDASSKRMDLTFQVNGDSSRLQALVDTSTALLTVGCPFKTIVVDPVTGISDAIISHIAKVNKDMLADPRRWAAMVGQKVRDTVLAFTQLPCHVVFIMHSQLDKNELSGSIVETPMIYSKYREIIGANLSQFFYATKVGGQPKVFTTDQGFVRGIGARWPSDLPAVCNPDFQSIYGKELAS